MTYRTKPSVEASISKRIYVGDYVQLVEYQPGNCTRYVLQLTDVRNAPLPAKKLLNIPEGGWILTRLETFHPGAMVIPSLGFLHWTYVAEHLHVNKADAVVITELIGFLTGRPATTSEQAVEEDGQRDDVDSDDRPTEQKIAF